MDEQNKNLEENAKKTYSEDHVLTMFEEIRGQGKIVIEQYADLTEKVVLLADDMNHVKSDIVDIKSDIKNIKKEVVEINEKLDIKTDKTVSDDHTKRIVKLEKKFA